MAKHVGPSRFSPAYLASRHAGMLFFFLALGLCAGVAWRSLFQPTRYQADGDVYFSVQTPPAAAFDWDAAIRRWQDIKNNPADQALLGANLRHIAKLAITSAMNLDAETLANELALFEPSRTFSAVLLPPRVAGTFGPSLTLTRRDVAANLDFQSLAAIVADLDPPRDAASWDFSFFLEDAGSDLPAHMVTRPGPNDRSFRVFYHLHELLAPNRPAPSPEEAWRLAVDEVAERLHREASFPGGGGFGHMARRELMREILAIPALAANSLYHAGAWSAGDGDFRRQDETWSWRWRNLAALSVNRQGDSGGAFAASMSIDLYPLVFPRDTVATRIPPLAVATLLAYATAKEQVTAPPPEPAPEPIQPPPPEPAPEPEEPEVAIVDVEPLPPPDEPPLPPPGTIANGEAEKALRDAVAQAEAAARKARLDRNAALRELEALREREKTLIMEALAARERADRLAERLDEIVAETTPALQPPVSLEVARLRLARDEVLERLANLLQTSTEEHPFVRQARRELLAIETRLAELDPGREEAREAAARETRVRNLRLEHRSALASADNLDERRRRIAGDIQNALNAVNSAERHVLEREAELAAARDALMKALAPTPAPVAKREPPPARPRPAPTPLREPDPIPEPPPPPPTTPAVRQSAATLRFAAQPQRIALRSVGPDWDAPIFGTLVGLCLGLAWLALREFASRRFANAYEARRMVNLSLLAVLPAYNKKAFRAAAKTMKGEAVANKAGDIAFIPDPIDFAEPKPVARRGKVTPAGRRLRWYGWAAGLAVLSLAALIHFGAARLGRPAFGFAELPLPNPASLDLPGEAGSAQWGNMP